MFVALIVVVTEQLTAAKWFRFIPHSVYLNTSAYPPRIASTFLAFGFQSQLPGQRKI